MSELSTSTVDQQVREGLPVWFGPATAPLFGWVHVPADGRARAAIVICPDFGLDRADTGPLARSLAGALAGSGVLAVRFDYDGCGSSAGSPTAMGRAAAWTASVRHANDLTRSLGVLPTSLLGIRTGALIAAAAAAEIDPDLLALWHPYRSGRQFLREQAVLLRILEASADTSTRRATGHAASATEPPAGAAPFPDLSELASFDLTTLARPIARRILLIAPPGSRAPRVVPESAAGAELITSEAPSPATKGLSRRDRTRLADTMTATLLERLGSTHRELTPLDLTALQGPAEGRVPAPCGQHQLIERPERLGSRRLFAMTTAIEGLHDLPAVVILGGETWRYPGSTTLDVELARLVASRGWRAVRLDVTGRGESDLLDDQEPFGSFPSQVTDDLVDAVSGVIERSRGKLALVGNCGTGYLALEVALATKANAALVVNPAMFFSPLEVAAGGALASNRRAALPPRRIFRRLLRGRAIDRLAYRRQLPSAVSFLIQHLIAVRPSTSVLSRLSDHQVRTILLLQPQAASLLLGGVRHTVKRLERTGGLSVRSIESSSVDHDLLLWSAPARAEIATALIDALSEIGGLDPSRSGPGDKPAQQVEPRRAEHGAEHQ